MLDFGGVSGGGLWIIGITRQYKPFGTTNQHEIEKRASGRDADFAWAALDAAGSDWVKNDACGANIYKTVIADLAVILIVHMKKHQNLLRELTFKKESGGNPG